jgi:DNA (cytosine-5)-methyltransferase 1
MEAKARLVAAFLRRYGVEFEGEFARVGQFIIWDIRMRMLVPRELFRAQGFPEDYVIGDGPGLTLSRTAQVRMVGNSVSPPLARAIVAANVPDLSAWFVDERHCAFPAMAAGSDRPQRPAVAVA